MSPSARHWLQLWLTNLLPLLAIAADGSCGLAQSASTVSSFTEPTQDATELRLIAARDSWISSVPQERHGSNGGAARMKLKSYQEMSLLDIDSDSLQPLKGRVVSSARLHVRSASDIKLKRITISSISSPWNEGTASGYALQKGASTFAHRSHPDVPWSYPGSDFTSVVLGQGNSRWKSSDASPPDVTGWQTIEVAPQVVAMRVAELSHGFLIFDDTGTEWTRTGEQFNVVPFPNRYMFSRDQSGQAAPFLDVVLGPSDNAPPAMPASPQQSSKDLPPGQVLVSWTCPEDRGPAGTLGFLAKLDGRPLPQYVVPLAGPAGSRVQMMLRDVAWPAGDSSRLTIAAIDGAGNRGPELVVEIKPPVPQPNKMIASLSLDPAVSTEPTRGNIDSLEPAQARLGKAELAIIDELDKVQPVSGQLIPPQPGDYLNRNHLWDAQAKTIRLHAAAKECVAFQVLVARQAGDIRPSIEFNSPLENLRASYGRYLCVPSATGPLPDPIVPLDRLSKFKSDETDHRYQSLHVELQLPAGVAPGKYTGKLILTDSGDTDRGSTRAGAGRPNQAETELAIELQVWPFELPDRLSFIPEMNCYGLPDNELDYYRLAQLHRTVLNRLPYAHRGTVDDGCAPVWDGQRFDWSQWDARFGPLLSGSAFADLPRGPVSVECFYLPLFENWPTPIGPHYNESYWADEALTAEYRRLFVLASQRIAEHVRERNWNGTLFQFYLNGKNDYKRNGWSRSTSPWILDEPAHFQDFWALRWFGQAFREGVDKVSGPQQVVFRADISRPQWQRDVLDGVLQVNVVSSAFRDYRRMVLERGQQFDQKIIEYGTSNRPDQSNVQPAAWCIDAWSLGIDGVLPWQTIGTEQSWQRADELSLFYPAQDRPGAPIPSVRLKAYRRGQQDVEYLAALQRKLAVPDWELRAKVRHMLQLDGPVAAAREATDNQAGEDAGRIGYSRLSPAQLHRLRMAIGQTW